jgi:hypothetical protein
LELDSGSNRIRRRHRKAGCMRPSGCIVIGLVLAGVTTSALAAEMKPAAIDAAEPSTKTLSNEKPTPAGVRLRVLLERAHFSPGEIDRRFGENAKKHCGPFEEAQQLPVSETSTPVLGKACCGPPPGDDELHHRGSRFSRSCLRRWRT